MLIEVTLIKQGMHRIGCVPFIVSSVKRRRDFLDVKWFFTSKTQIKIHQKHRMKYIKNMDRELNLLIATTILPSNS